MNHLRTLALIALAWATTTAAAVDLKPGEQLPYARVTVRMPDGTTRTDTGWWDKDLLIVFHDTQDALAAPYTSDRIVAVEVAPPANVHKRMPDFVRTAIAERQASKRAEQAARESSR